MRNMCVLTCNGRICKEPKVYNQPDGSSFCSFPIAVDYTVRKGDTWESVAMFFDVISYQKGIFEYLEKGRLISVTGSLSFPKWVDVNGVERENHTIKADCIELLPRGASQENQQENKPSPNTYKTTYSNAPKSQPVKTYQTNKVQQVKPSTTIKNGPDSFSEEDVDF